MIDSLTPEDFEEHQSSVIAAVSEKPKRLSSRCGVIDVEISRRTYDFDKQKKLVQELDKITLAETKKYFHVGSIAHFRIYLPFPRPFCFYVISYIFLINFISAGSNQKL